MDTKEAGRRGALITNTKLTTQGRSRAAKKGWRLHKKKNLETLIKVARLQGAHKALKDAARTPTN